MKEPTLKMVETEIKRLDPKLEVDSKGFKIAVLLLASALIGANMRRLSKFTGYPLKFIRAIARRCRKNKVWIGGRVNSEPWFEKKLGGINFWLDVCVGKGYVRKREAKPIQTRGQAGNPIKEVR